MEAVKSYISSHMPDLYLEHHHKTSEQIGQQLTAEEVQKHPEFPHVVWDLKADQKDKVEVAKGRGGPLKIAYELHGRGPKKIVVRQNLRHAGTCCVQETC